MSPILKRDVAETVRQARRLAAAAGLRDYDEYGEYELDPVGVSKVAAANTRSGGAVASGSAEWDRDRERTDHERGREVTEGRSTSLDLDHGESYDNAPLLRAHDDSESVTTTMSAIEGKWGDLKGLLFSSTPSLLFGLLGLVFSGELLEHCARWRVFRRVDELFILVPMIGNLKGNLEMCLSARLGTSATLGELDGRQTRRSLLIANMTLLGLQALLISSLAAVISFLLGLITIHRLGDVPAGSGPSNGTVSDPSQSDPWREGTTRPGGAQLVMVLATGMGAAGLSSLALGSFMSSLVVVCRWKGVDPDNITPPVAACLGDLVTLFVLALIGTLLVGAMDTVGPLLGVILMGAAASWFTVRVLRDEWVRNIARGAWLPLIGAMLISSGTGMVLESGVGKYRGFALLAISMTGLTGSLGAIHANRLSTTLHTALHPESRSSRERKAHGLTPGQSIIVLFVLAFPCQGAFLLFVHFSGWSDVDLGWVGWVAYTVTTIFSLVVAHYLTIFCWWRDLDPDSYTLPLHSATVDLVGQIVLMCAYELCIWRGNTSVMEVADSVRRTVM